MLEEHKDLAMFEELSWREKLRKIMAGLRAPRDSGDYKYAILETQRIVAPFFSSTGVCLAVLIILATVVSIARDTTPTDLDVIIVEPETEELEVIE